MRYVNLKGDVSLLLGSIYKIFYIAFHNLPTIIIMEEYIKFPNGSKVCRLGQGTWMMGRNKSKRNDEITALQHGIELGMNLIDTAELYENEELVGEAIKEYRDRVFIVSKVMPSNADYRGTKRACERSLQRLKTDKIDLFLLHWIGKYPFEETVKAFQELEKEGKIGAWGVSNLDVRHMEHIDRISSPGECATDQVLYNLKERGVEFDLIPWCAERNIPVMAYSPLGEGLMLNDKTLRKVAEKHSASPAQIALAWSLRLPDIISIPKAGNISHVEDNFKSLSIELTPEDLKELDIAFPPPSRKIILKGW